MALLPDKQPFELILSAMWILAGIRVSYRLALGGEFGGLLSNTNTIAEKVE
jgi:hypothetical protein